MATVTVDPRNLQNALHPSTPAAPAAAAAPPPSGGLFGGLTNGINKAVGNTLASASAPAKASGGGGLFGALTNGINAAAQGAVAAGAQQKQAAADSLARDPTTIDNQMGSARRLATGLGQQGQAIQNSQSALSQNLGAQAQTFSASAQPSGFKTGTQVQGANQGAVANVAPSALGSYGSVAGQLGGAPGAVSTGQLGNVGMTAGQLGAAPTVGNVGNIQMGGTPGAVAGTFGQQGVASPDQASMLSRLNGFLDAPEGPSVAQSQLAQSQAQNMSQLLGAARSGRGGAGAQAQALAGAMSEGGAIASDTAGQMATLRAQEEDMRKNRALSAIGLGGDMATAARGQDLSARAQDLAAAQGDQATSLGARGQDLQGAMANQQTQTALEQLRANTALGARGQNLSALQGDQSAALGMRGQNLSALQGNQQTALGARGQNLDALSQDLNAQIAARGQNLSALQGNQQAGLTARGQNITQEANVLGANTAMRGQDLTAMNANADRGLAAQQLSLQGRLGLGELANTANGQGLQFLSQANQQALGAEGLAQDALNNQRNNLTSINNTNTSADAAVRQQILANQAKPTFGESMALAGVGALGNAGGGLLSNAALLSDERAKTDVRDAGSAFDEHLRVSPGKRYRYLPGFGEDPAEEQGGPMAQDLERSPFGRSIVKRDARGYRKVDIGRLALVDHAALSSMRSELDRLKEELAA